MNLDDFDYGALGSPAPQTGTARELSETEVLTDERPKRSSSFLEHLDTRVAVQVVVAVILVAAGVGLFVRETWARQIRDAAVRQIETANDRSDYLSVIKASENFLSHPPINGARDAREGTVVNRYSEALVHWVAQQPAKLDAKANERIARYKQLVKSPNK
jgi:hypothetical protein